MLFLHTSLLLLVLTGVAVGTHWETRLECSNDGVHRMTVAGIHGSDVDGCYSVCLSGGYEDDVDCGKPRALAVDVMTSQHWAIDWLAGDAFTYTGEGGRDLKGTKANPKNLRTAPQSKDQTLTKCVRVCCWVVG